MHQITLHDTGIPQGISAIVRQLPSPERMGLEKDITAVEINFSSKEFIYMTGLVLLAAWRKALPPGVQVVVEDSDCAKPTQYFLTNTGFREIIDTGHETPSVQKRIGRVPLQPIANQFTKEATVTDIVSIFDEYAHHVQDMNPFRVMISELCENVLAHSESTSPGYICARVLETQQRRRAEIAIADTGIGIRGSYLSGSNESVKIRIKKGASPLEIALQGLNWGLYRIVPTPPVTGSGSGVAYAPSPPGL